MLRCVHERTLALIGDRKLVLEELRLTDEGLFEEEQVQGTEFKSESD